METTTTFKLKLFTSLFFYFSLSFSLQAQTTSAAAYESEVRALNLDILRLNEQAATLRKNARSADVTGREIMTKEASAMEAESMKKQVQLYTLSYNYKQNTYANNKNRISTLQKMVADKSNSNHNKYLVEEAARNFKLAGQLAEEGKRQSSPPLALGVLDNADEKMDLAISQQNQVIENLERTSGKLAKTK